MSDAHPPPVTKQPACRIEIRALSPDPETPSAGQMIAAAEPAGDGHWHMHHRDGRHVTVETTVEVVERMIMVACDTSLAEHWRRTAALLPTGSERADTLRDCAADLDRSARSACATCGGATAPQVTHPPAHRM